MYLDAFSLPIDEEYVLLDKQRKVRGFIDNAIPAVFFSEYGRISGSYPARKLKQAFLQRRMKPFCFKSAIGQI